MSENKRYKPKKASIKRLIIAFILIIAVAAGIYALLTKNDDQANENNNEVKVHSEETKETTKKPSKVAKEEAEKVVINKGTVTKETSDTPEEQVTEGKTNEADTNLQMPTYNKDAIIANAKAQVYTVYTDLQQGSGFLIDSKGDILTNAHVAKDAGFVVVKNEHGQEFQGKVIGISKKIDVAVVRVPDLAGKNPLVLDTTTATVGTKVVAIGSPKDQYGTTTEGIIQSIGAEFVDEYTYSHLYEITAKLNRGSSGGPLINAETGNVIGINSIILEDHPEIGYAIPLSAVMGLVDGWTASNETITFDNGEDDFNNNHADEAYFSEDLLKENMESYYELIRQSLINGKENYYQSYILENSDALNTAISLVDSYKMNKKYQSLEATVQSITIGDEASVVNMNTILTYIDKKTNIKQTIEQSFDYTIVIDDFGSYMISNIAINSTVDSGDVVAPPPATSDEENKDAETNTEAEPDAVIPKEDTDEAPVTDTPILDTSGIEEKPETEEPATDESNTAPTVPAKENE
ncbi:MAG: serine protease [Kurthia sp.]|nr:serine protease [Candidatus Kurthia equi]